MHTWIEGITAKTKQMLEILFFVLSDLGNKKHWKLQDERRNYLHSSQRRPFLGRLLQLYMHASKDEAEYIFFALIRFRLAILHV